MELWGGDYEALQFGFIVGHSLLTAKGIPCAGEGDLKTCVAGHDGPFHLAIANGKPLLRGLGVYHGKQGTGVSVEAKVRAGDIWFAEFPTHHFAMSVGHNASLFEKVADVLGILSVTLDK